MADVALADGFGAETPTTKKKKGVSPFLILSALIAGGVFGYLCPSWAVELRPVGDAFVKLIKMIIVPLVFSMLVMGIAGSGDFKKVGRIGGKTLLWFTFASTIAMILGLILANVFKPGHGVELIKVAGEAVSPNTVHFKSTVELIQSIIPDNIFGALVKADLLQVVFFSCLFGVAVAAAKEQGKPVLALAASVSDAMLRVTGYIMYLSPLAVFSFIGWTIGKYGLGLVIPLSKLILTLYFGLAFFIVVILVTACLIIKVNFFQVIRIIKTPLLLAFTTCSSEAALPSLMERLERFGVPKHIVGFVLPAGYSFNLDGSSIYKCLALMFIAQMYNIPMDIPTQLAMLGMMLIVQKGSAGVPGAAFMGLSAGVLAFNLPMDGLFMIMGVDRILDMGRTSTNLVGNAIATLVVARWEGELPDEVIKRGYSAAYDD